MGEFGIVGDPAGMRSLADQLVTRASSLREASASMKKKWSNVKFKGPFATTVNAVLKAQWSQWGVAADGLDAAAKLLRSSADDVQDKIDAARRRHERLERERLERERAAQKSGG